MKAAYWHVMESGLVCCDLCPHHCVIKPGRTGMCRVRVAEGQTLEAAGYGQLSSVHIDPIEKKPLYHFLPGTQVFSVGGWGCNLGCVFCQNWAISQDAAFGGPAQDPRRVIAHARQSGAPSIAYTYNEPLVGFEFVRDCARLAREAGLLNVLVTNGYVETAPAAELLPWIDAINLDIKSMDDAFYRTHCRGTLAPVLAFACQAVHAGCHVEITNLVIPTLNDGDARFEALARWVASNLGARTPLHLSAYHPDYKLGLPATPPGTLADARRICAEHLAYVYMGNVLSREGQDTCCPGCGHALIARRGYEVQLSGLEDRKCRHCGRPADVRFA